MALPQRLASSVLMALGVLLVFLGVTAALGSTIIGTVASAAAIAGLLYVGGLWFGTAAPASPTMAAVPILVFDHERRVVSGGVIGQPLSLHFPEILRAEIDRRCADALRGTSARFPCLQNGKMVVFDAIPVRTADGTIVYGILLSADLEPAEVAATA
jgi:hypothetical protein